ncbi:MAG: hypothetical protein JKY48_14920, partial [Flavobacteriales bacterium]|nr:hypothetical protein [Flavobacteriales bacterium]
MKKALLIVVKLYFHTWALSSCGILALAFRSDISLERSFKLLKQLLQHTEFIISLHILFITLYLLFLVIRYFIRLYKKSTGTIVLKQFLVRICIPILVLVSTYKTITYNNKNEAYDYEWDSSLENKGENATNKYSFDGMHRGIHVFGWKEDNEKAIDELVRNNIEWVAIVPFFYQKDEQSNQISFVNREYLSQEDSLFMNTIEQLHNRGIHVLLKPHLWLTNGWRANIKFDPSDDENSWFNSYQKGMMHYARLAAKSKVELLCLGTELKSSVQEQPEEWEK